MASTLQSDHEEMVLQALMLHFTNFSFDKAKDQAVREYPEYPKEDRVG